MTNELQNDDDDKIKFNYSLLSREKINEFATLKIVENDREDFRRSH